MYDYKLRERIDSFEKALDKITRNKSRIVFYEIADRLVAL